MRLDVLYRSGEEWRDATRGRDAFGDLLLAVVGAADRIRAMLPEAHGEGERSSPRVLRIRRTGLKVRCGEFRIWCHLQPFLLLS
jgi:hypothetical protein